MARCVFSQFITTKNMMTESEFLRLSDRIFTYIEENLEELDDDFDCYTLGNVLTIEYADGTQIIINRHLVNSELWIAAKSGGYHFAPQAGTWYSERDHADFFTILNRVLSEAAQSEIVIPPFEAA